MCVTRIADTADEQASRPIDPAVRRWRRAPRGSALCGVVFNAMPASPELRTRLFRNLQRSESPLFGRVFAQRGYVACQESLVKKILVALDGSPRADGVLAYALSLARLAGAKLVLFRAFGIPPDMALAWPLSDLPLELALRAQAEKYLDTCAERVPSELLDGVRVAVGTPWQAMCQAARDESVDLVVIGSHGYSGLDHLLGTTAARVVNHVDRPVVVVRPLPVHS